MGHLFNAVGVHALGEQNICGVKIHILLPSDSVTETGFNKWLLNCSHTVYRFRDLTENMFWTLASEDAAELAEGQGWTASVASVCWAEITQ